MSTWLQAARNELQNLLADYGVLMVLVGGTLFYALFYPLPYRDQVAREVPVAVVDLDRSVTSRQLIRMLDATEQIRVEAVLRDSLEGKDWLQRGKVGGLVEIPADFERHVLRGEITRVGIWGNAAYVLLYSQVATGAANATGTFSTGVLVTRLEGQGIPTATALNQALPVELALHELFNPGGGYGSYVVPAVLVLILQQTLLIGVGMMGAGQALRQRQQQTGEHPVTGLLARGLPYLAIHLLLALLILLVVYRLYAFPSPVPALMALLVLLPFLVAVIQFGFLLASCFRNRETVLEIMILISLPTLFLAGFMWPAEAMPPLLSSLGWLMPSTAGIDAFVRFHQMGASFGEIASSWFWLWGLALFYFLLTLLVIRFTRLDSPHPRS